LSDRTTFRISDPTRIHATVGVDLDPVDVHLAGYGLASTHRDATIYEVGVPRLLEIFAKHGVRATFFALGRDAQPHAASLRMLEAAGHEVACHSMTHPAALARLRPDRLEVELVQSKAQLEDALGTAVVGFRAPNWDLDRVLLGRLATAGYAYDASTIPSPFLPLLRFAVAARSRRPGMAMRLRLTPMTTRVGPRTYEVAGRSITEFPVSVTRFARLPIYHTMRSMISDAALDRHLDGLAVRGLGLDYAVHGIDALGLVEDRVDIRMARHPGMEASLTDKLALLDRTISSIAARFAAVPYRDRLSEDLMA
jgi:peptidoglycan-N-acetylglucosamine deacetylase